MLLQANRQCHVSEHLSAGGVGAPPKSSPVGRTFDLCNDDIQFRKFIQFRFRQRSAKARCCARASVGLAGGQVIATARPFCFFCGYDKRNSLRGDERTEVSRWAQTSFQNAPLFVKLNLSIGKPKRCLSLKRLLRILAMTTWVIFTHSQLTHSLIYSLAFPSAHPHICISAHQNHPHIQQLLLRINHGSSRFGV